MTAPAAIAPTRAAYALIDVSYEAAVARRASHDLIDAARAALAAGATWDELDAAVGGLEIIDVLAILAEDPR
jgi:hypothetical protein